MNCSLTMAESQCCLIDLNIMDLTEHAPSHKEIVALRSLLRMRQTVDARETKDAKLKTTLKVFLIQLIVGESRLLLFETSPLSGFAPP
jgi:hypothetical protein